MSTNELAIYYLQCMGIRPWVRRESPRFQHSHTQYTSRAYFILPDTMSSAASLLLERILFFWGSEIKTEVIHISCIKMELEGINEIAKAVLVFFGVAHPVLEGIPDAHCVDSLDLNQVVLDASKKQQLYSDLLMVKDLCNNGLEDLPSDTKHEI